MFIVFLCLYKLLWTITCLIYASYSVSTNSQLFNINLSTIISWHNTCRSFMVRTENLYIIYYMFSTTAKPFYLTLRTYKCLTKGYTNSKLCMVTSIVWKEAPVRLYNGTTQCLYDSQNSMEMSFFCSWM